MVNNNLPVRLGMFRWRFLELAWLKGMEVKLNSLRAGACAELEPAIVKWRTRELAVREGLRNHK